MPIELNAAFADDSLEMLEDNPGHGRVSAVLQAKIWAVAAKLADLQARMAIVQSSCLLRGDDDFSSLIEEPNPFPTSLPAPIHLLLIEDSADGGARKTIDVVSIPLTFVTFTLEREFEPQ